MTLFATTTTLAIPPIMASTVVIDPKVIYRSLYSLLKQFWGRSAHLNCSIPELIYHSLFCRRYKSILIPLWASAPLPRHCAKIAELSPAAARHVVAAEIELNQSLATWASLPSLSLCKGSQLNGGLVDSTV